MTRSAGRQPIVVALTLSLLLHALAVMLLPVSGRTQECPYQMIFMRASTPFAALLPIPLRGAGLAAVGSGV